MAGALTGLGNSDEDAGNATTQQASGPLMLDALFPREREVVELLAAGHTTESTGHQLGISRPTVKAIRSKLYKRFGVNSAIDLLLRFYRLAPLPR